MLGARSPGVRARTIAALPLCPRAGAHRADQRRRETRRRNTVDRMARWRAAAHEVLARHCRKEHFIPRSGRSRKNAVAGRARLPGAQAKRLPPPAPHAAGNLKNPAIPDSYRPRGAADPAPTSRSQLDRHAASTLDRRDRKNAAKMSILRKKIQKDKAPCFLTQYD